jgi:polysaccharide biosynthesis protein PslA
MQDLELHRTQAQPGDHLEAPLSRILLKPLGVLRDRRMFRKRCFDIPLTLLLLVVAAPAIVLIALAVKIDSRGPVFFRQPRYGLGRERVVVTKFRTLRVEATDVGGKQQVRLEDDRITRVGSFLRASCLDELPQLYDVLCGRMSLVGPRPHPLDLEVDGMKIDEIFPYYHIRHTMLPGITGLAQVRGNRGPLKDLKMCVERLIFDLEYLQQSSIKLDLYILLKTLLVPFQRGRSY